MDVMYTQILQYTGNPLWWSLYSRPWNLRRTFKMSLANSWLFPTPFHLYSSMALLQRENGCRGSEESRQVPPTICTAWEHAFLEPSPNSADFYAYRGFLIGYLQYIKVCLWNANQVFSPGMVHRRMAAFPIFQSIALLVLDKWGL